MYDRRAFAVTGPTVWNSLQDNLRGIRICYYRQLQAFVKNVFVLIVPVRLTHKMCYDDALYKFTFYLLTCLLQGHATEPIASRRCV